MHHLLNVKAFLRSCALHIYTHTHIVSPSPSPPLPPPLTRLPAFLCSHINPAAGPVPVLGKSTETIKARIYACINTVS